jgi:hypothetical protein
MMEQLINHGSLMQLYVVQVAAEEDGFTPGKYTDGSHRSVTKGFSWLS